MQLRTLAAAGLLFLFSTSASAFHCPADVKAIDNALGKVTLSDSQKAEVKRLRDEGEAQHKAGDHGASVKTLAEAMRLILNNL